MKKLLLLIALFIALPAQALPAISNPAFIRAFVFIANEHEKTAEAKFDRAVLVHGTITTALNGTIPAAWVLFSTEESLVFDALRQRFFEKREYYKLSQAIEERRYTENQAKRMYAQFRHAGPWHYSHW